MDIIAILIVLVVVGIILWAVNAYLPIEPPFKNIIMFIAIVAVCLWLLSQFVGGGTFRTR